ncbi:hypothetical protein [Micromonospora wenchangensis]|uniref:Glycerophosphoryl diester phosphodiesterase membrane domain-containing protein n=1 Tax=Micromonospora wenchangensis TaxID=1185415 RepID=A0A246RPX8_9ACTN|nr:hypothetical protein [Micromonospora wenchangensis]OWV09825.1 hypothetical protein B5D80_08225 [Micromonospora wenchangensis]
MSDQSPSGPPDPAAGSPGGPWGQPPWGTPAGQQPWGAPSGQPGWGQPGAWPPGWSYPAPGGPYPGYPPGAGGGFPPGGGHPPFAGPGPWGPEDPLVNPPYAGLEGWFSRCTGAVRRSWRPLLPLMLLTQVVPAVAVSLLSLGMGPDATVLPADGSLPEGYLSDLVIYGVSVFLVALALGVVQGIGWAGGTWVVTRQAAGQPADLPGALRYGARRCLGLWGWMLVLGVLIGVGFCLCLLPGIYLAFALALAGPVYLFEGQNPVGRSFRMFHDRLGMVLGRVALVALAVFLGSVLGSVVESVGTVPFGTDPFTAPGTAVGAVAVILVSAVLVLPVYLVQLVGLVVTYAEQRAQEGPVNVTRLVAELG